MTNGSLPGLDANAIHSWADRREAHHQLPELVRRLLLASGTVTGILIPSGAAIALPGVDGWVQSSGATPWVPAGESVWEVSCNGSPGQKADSDYSKRTAEISAEQRQRMTYVQLSARKWNKKEQWADKRRQEDSWADVRALDAHDLEAWLKQHAPVALLLAEWLGMAGYGNLSPEVYFRHWACMAEPAISIDALLAGRDMAVNSFVSLLRGQERHVPLLADSSEEAVAIACAAVSSCPDLACRSVVVNAPEGWQFVRTNPGIDNVVATSPDIIAHGAGFRGILVFPAQTDLLHGQGNDQDTLVRFDRPLRHEFIDALDQLGIPRDEADVQAVHSGRSWSAWRRLHQAAPGLLSDPGEVGKLLDGRLAATLCLIDRWDDANEDDWAFVCKAGGVDREETEQALRDLASMDDPPVVHAGGMWKVKAPLEFFQLHAHRITSPLLERFLSEAERLLCEPDPLLQYPPKEREAVRLAQDVKQEWSGLLRQAIADGLARLGTLAPEHGLLQHLNPQDRVARVVSALLQDAELERWLSISGLLPTLAEADPRTFLAAVEAGVADEGSPVAALTSLYEEGLLAGHIYRTGLLWALEKLAWNPEFMPRVALVLAHLARLPLHERDNWANTPMNTLVSIFRSWWPQTCAPMQQRQEVLELLTREMPDIAFSLLKKLLRFGPDSATPNSRPLWRPWGRECEVRPDMAERVASLRHAAGLIFELAGLDASRLEPLVMQIGDLHELDPKLAGHVVDRLSEVSEAGTDEDRADLRDALRNVLQWPCRLPEDMKRKCRKTWEDLAPHDVVVRHAWLFGQSPQLPEEGDIRDWEKEEQRVQQWRTRATHEIFKEAGWKGITRLMQQVDDPWGLGMSVARCGLSETGEYVLLLEPAYRESPEYPFLAGYLHGLDERDCKEFLSDMLTRAERESWTAERVGTFLTAAPFCKEVREVADQAHQEIRKLYWKRCHPRFFLSEENNSRENDRIVAERLLSAGRPWSLLQAPGFRAQRFSEGILLELLERIVAGEEMEGVASGDIAMSRYHLHEVVDFLEASVSVDRQRLVRIEYGLLPLFVNDLCAGPEKLQSLMKTIMSDPAVFVDLLCKTYKGECEDMEDESEEVSESTALMLWNLFHSGLRTQPGGYPYDTSKGVNPARFQGFIDKVLELAAFRCRRRIAEHVLGQIIGRGPTGSDGLVPQEAARAVLDRPELEEMRTGLYFGLINKRGVTTRGSYEGGRQEKELADQYRKNADALRTQYPRLAATLDQVANSYEREAAEHDADAARTREQF